jgi:2-keto-4-pentenoate hydratase/2-oxohepta-3-ene-1,7-dioic acid hydratase in catechol pathway
MKRIGYIAPGGNRRFAAIVDDVGRDLGDTAGAFSSDAQLGAKLELKNLRRACPVAPSKIVCVGRNYVDHAKELGNEPPKQPMLFLKAPSALIGPGEKIQLTPQSESVHYEGELAVVIGRKARDVRREDAAHFILGYTCFNDVTARDLQQLDGQWGRAKCFDTFAPCGPHIETDLDLQGAQVSTFVNGELRQHAAVLDVVFDPYFLVQYISSVMTLYPGDVIATGTPAGVGPLNPGDVVRVTITGIGELENPVV